MSSVGDLLEKKPETVTLNLSDPNEARKFFREFRGFNDKPLEEVFHQKQGLVKPLLMSDREVCEMALYFYETLYAKGIGYFVKEPVH